MKKVYLSLAVSLMLINPAFSEGFGAGGGYAYVDGGGIYTNITLPSSVAKSVNFENIHQKHSKDINLSELRVGTSTTANILGLVQIGDAGIMAAAKNGNIKKFTLWSVKIQRYIYHWALFQSM